MKLFIKLVWTTTIKILLEHGSQALCLGVFGLDGVASNLRCVPHPEEILKHKNLNYFLFIKNKKSYR